MLNEFDFDRCKRNGCNNEAYDEGWCKKHVPFDPQVLKYEMQALEWERDYWKREAELARAELLAVRREESGTLSETKLVTQSV